MRAGILRCRRDNVYVIAVALPRWRAKMPEKKVRCRVMTIGQAAPANFPRRPPCAARYDA
jgi:hypothetical protein